MSEFIVGMLVGGALTLCIVGVGLALYALWVSQAPPYNGGPEL